MVGAGYSAYSPSSSAMTGDYIDETIEAICTAALLGPTPKGLGLPPHKPPRPACPINLVKLQKSNRKTELTNPDKIIKRFRKKSEELFCTGQEYSDITIIAPG